MMQKVNMVALKILKQIQNKPNACEFYYDKEILTCGSLLSTRSRSQFWVFLSKVQRSRRRRKEESCLGSEWNELLHDR